MSVLTMCYVYGLLITYALFVGVKVSRSVQMLQQNSYRNERFAKWINTHPKQVFMKRDLIPLISILLFVVGTKVTAIVFLIISFLLLSFLQERKQQKKPLAVTARVKRLFVTIGLIYLAIYGLTFLVFGTEKSNGIYVTMILTVCAFLHYYVVRFANLLNTPIEKRINRGYINDAMRMIDEMKSLDVIGVTGSYGKTSVKHILHTILSSKFSTLMTPESYNTPMGVTITIRNQLKPIHEVFIAEMGAKQIGDIQEICEIVHPKYAVITAIGPQHLETFGSLENVQKTKFEIVESLPADGVAFLNIDDKNIASYQVKNPCKIITYGIDHPEAYVRAKEIVFNGNGSSFMVEVEDEEVQFQSKLLGKHNVYNVLCAIAVGLEMGIPLKKMAAAVQKVRPVQHRLELRKVNAHLTIIDDAFNSNPVGSKMALEVLKVMPGQKIMMTPGMIELGQRQYDCNYDFGVLSADVCDYVILVGPKQTQPIQDGLQSVHYPKEKMIVVANLNEGFKAVNQVAKGNSFVLIENDLPDSFNEK